MNTDIAQQRLHKQHLSSTDFTRPQDVVAWLGAVQAQDYQGAKWALGQRMRFATNDSIEQAFAEGRILRTHLMRPTWHFVTPADIRWLLKLTAPRVRAIMSHYDRKLELDEAVFKRSNQTLRSALKGGVHLTRDELRKVVQGAGIVTKGSNRLAHILMRAELDGLICSGPRKGKQFTYALLEERVPSAKELSRQEALAELTRCYFTSHGPALIKDFVWWSGLTVADARAGLEMVQSHIVEEVIDGKTYWLAPTKPMGKLDSGRAYLLPDYDEYFISYKDRSAILNPGYSDETKPVNTIFTSTILIGARIVGGWKRTVKKNALVIELHPYATFSKDERKAITEAVDRYGTFLEMSITLDLDGGKRIRS